MLNNDHLPLIYYFTNMVDMPSLPNSPGQARQDMRPTQSRLAEFAKLR